MTQRPNFPADMVDELARASGMSAAEVNDGLFAIASRGYLEIRSDASGTYVRPTMPQDRGSAFDPERQRTAIDQIRASGVLDHDDDDVHVVVAVGLLVGETAGQFTEDEVVTGSADVNVMMAARYVLAEAAKGPAR